MSSHFAIVIGALISGCVAAIPSGSREEILFPDVELDTVDASGVWRGTRAPQRGRVEGEWIVVEQGSCAGWHLHEPANNVAKGISYPDGLLELSAWQCATPLRPHRIRLIK